MHLLFLHQFERIRILTAFLVASALAYRGRRGRALSPSGAIAAFVVGLVAWASGVRFGVTLIAFYLTCTRATRFRSRVKARIEHGYAAPAGNRAATQVLASSLPAVILALIHVSLYRYDGPLRAGDPGRSALALAYMLFFASCAGDTFASELGSVLPGPGCEPALILPPFPRVPRGTNGGVTWEGTIASFVGGAVIGVVFFATGGVDGWRVSQVPIIPLGAFGGLVGSALDSVAGALFQSSIVDTRSGKVFREVPVEGSLDALHSKHVCGRDLLSGEAVNALASILTASSAPVILPLFFR
jgi:uncharacterized protein (TIGR00297 family)